ncbi:MAG: DeoR family transcriptional regulator [Frankiales bacterium]|nr:DeoR family transcriptional regulator [Frankiales bacterium]
MRVNDRRQLILDAVHQRGLLTMRDVTSLVGTSEATARRDLRHLAEEGLIRRTHGGAAPSRLVSREAPYLEKAQQAAAEKHAIAAAAAAMISDGDTVAIGPGTTTFALAQLLTAVDDLTVVTNSVLVCAALERASNVHLLLSGGLVRNSTHALVGPLAEQSISGLFVSTLYLSGNGLSAARGLSTPDVLAAAVDRRLVMSAARVVVLVDHTKVGVETMSQTAGPEHISCVITDDQADPAELERLRQAGIEVVVTSPGATHGQEHTASYGEIHRALALPRVESKKR